MERKFVDISFFQSRKMEKDGNADKKYWHDKSIKERLKAASTMIAVAFNEPDFLKKKVDRTIFSARKHAT